MLHKEMFDAVDRRSWRHPCDAWGWYNGLADKGMARGNDCGGASYEGKMSEKIFVSADGQMRDSFRMAREIMESGWEPDVLVGLWRGGTPIAIAIHEYLVYKGRHPIHMPIKCSSYTGMAQTHELRIDFPENFLEAIREGTKVLIVDDTFDTGLTTAKLKEIIASRGADVRIAVLVWKPTNNKTSIEPDYWAWTTDKWVVFPHELEDLTPEEIRMKDPEMGAILGL